MTDWTAQELRAWAVERALQLAGGRGNGAELVEDAAAIEAYVRGSEPPPGTAKLTALRPSRAGAA